MSTTINIDRPQGSTAQLVFNILDSEGVPQSLVDWTNFELTTYVEPAKEYSRIVTFTDSRDASTFSQQIRVIIGDTFSGVIVTKLHYEYIVPTLVVKKVEECS